jgi:hypothetical protein
MQIDQPIPKADIMNAILNSDGVISLVDFKVSNLSGKIDTRTYSDVTFSVDGNTIQEMIVGPNGSMFEVRYPSDDIVVTVR